MTGPRRRRPPAQPRTAREVLAASQTEDQWQTFVLELAERCGWLRVHFLAVRLPSGEYGVPFVGDGGFPDLVLARGGVVLLVELKRQDGRYGPGQEAWARALGASHRLWRPSDRDEVVRTLTARRTRRAA